MGMDLWIVKHTLSEVGRDYIFFEWLESNFADDSNYGFISQVDFEDKIKCSRPGWIKEHEEAIGEMRKQFRIERLKLPVEKRKYFDGFAFSIA